MEAAHRAAHSTARSTWGLPIINVIDLPASKLVNWVAISLGELDTIYPRVAVRLRLSCYTYLALYEKPMAEEATARFGKAVAFVGQSAGCPSLCAVGWRQVQGARAAGADRPMPSPGDGQLRALRRQPIPWFRDLAFHMLRRVLEMAHWHVPGAAVDWNFQSLLQRCEGSAPPAPTFAG
jgi:hypothetical protein